MSCVNYEGAHRPVKNPPTSKEEMIQELNQLLQATKGAISYLESDAPIFPSTEPMKPNSFTVGNFLVTRL